MQQRCSDFNNKNLEFGRRYDVIILGTGIAGLFTALNISEQYQVLLITKTSIKNNNSSLAQGGIATSRDRLFHYNDTMRAGAYYNNKEAVKILTTESEVVINKLINYGVFFDRDDEGNLLYTLEGGHTESNVLHVRDETGKSIIEALSSEVRKRKNIEVLENTFVLDVIGLNYETKGVVFLEQTGKKKGLIGKAVVLATGGIGQLYCNTTNEKITTGDGIAMASRAGAKIKDMEFIQFHPTALFTEINQQRFLISEAVRGEGAILRNKNGEAFMIKYHEKRELAPRDIVARAIYNEMVISNHPCVYLDITHREANYIRNRFPMIYAKCLSLGIDMTKEWVPVAPAEHYVMGGISTDLNGRTSIKHLYACGECACTGVHGANRLASNSLLEGIVFANRVAIDINTNLAYREVSARDMQETNQVTTTGIHNRSIDIKEPMNGNIDLNEVEELIKNTMNQYVSITRSREGLIKANVSIKKAIKKLKDHPVNTIQYYELINMVTVAYEIIESALKRLESLGSHYIIEKTHNEEEII